MIIDFEKEQKQVIPHFKNGDGIIEVVIKNDELNRIMKCTIKNGSSIGHHLHETSSEIIYVLEGSGKVIEDGIEKRLETGCCHYCPKGHSHSVINDGNIDLVVFAVVTNQ